MLCRKFLVSLLPFFVCSYEEHNFFRNDYTYNKDTNYWFKIGSVPVNWHDARRKCEYEGAVLASPLNSKILTALQCSLDEKHLRGAYIGLHSTFSGSDWQSIDGIPIQDMNLDESMQFSQDTSRKCAVVESKKIITVNCSEIHPYICYKEATNVPCFTECGTTDEEYKLNLRTGSCYKFHNEGVIWSRAFEICTAEGGHLAIINNATEVEVITELYKKNPSSTIKASYTELVYIGIRDWEENGDWYTVHGEPLNKNEYSRWSDGEPNNALKNEFCGTVLRNGRFNDAPCTCKLAFICEKDPKSLAASSTPTIDLRRSLPDNSGERF